MRWEKLGLIYAPDRSLPWQQSHVQNPFPEQLSEHVFRVFFASRDAANTSRSGYFDLDMRDPYAVKNSPAEPILDLGDLGAFDDCGAMPHSIVKMNGDYVLYYTGWSKAVATPFTFYIGAARAASLDGPFTRISKAPVLGRNYFDPFLTAAPYVVKVDNYYLMYYVTCIKWEKDADGNLKHYYTITSATSSDGINWAPNPRILVPLEEDEYAIARPVLFKDGDRYELWFSFRGAKTNTYNLGLAVSTDLVNWKREPVGMEFSEPGAWDSEMICYAHPFYYKGEKYILYNGNAYGATGTGLAKLLS